MSSYRLAALGLILAIVGLFALVISKQYNPPTNIESANQGFFSSLSNNVTEITYESNIAIPFNLTDINRNEGTLNPFGVRRDNNDPLGLGHIGIDFPLNPNSPIYAAYYGEVLSIEDSEYEAKGKKITILLNEKALGEGWAFIYQNVVPIQELTNGQEVKRGQLIANSMTADNPTHFQLTRLLADHSYTQNDQCWIENLNSIDKQSITKIFDEYATTEYFNETWKTAIIGGRYPFRGLLFTNNFPKPELCYPKGIDVR